MNLQDAFFDELEKIALSRWRKEWPTLPMQEKQQILHEFKHGPLMAYKVPGGEKAKQQERLAKIFPSHGDKSRTGAARKKAWKSSMEGLQTPVGPVGQRGLGMREPRAPVPGHTPWNLSMIGPEHALPGAKPPALKKYKPPSRALKFLKRLIKR